MHPICFPGYLLKLKIHGELNLMRPVAAIGCLNPVIGVKSEPKTGLIWGNVRTVEHVEEFRYHVEAFASAEWEVLQDAQVHRCQCGCIQRISAEVHRSCRKRKCVTLVRVKARQRIHGPPTL